MPIVTLNSVDIQGPTEHGWVAPEAIGVGAAGNAVISAVWSYALSWSIMTPAEFQLVWDIWNDNQGVDITASLPEIGIATYSFKSYTCRINPIVFTSFFETTYRGVSTTLIGIDITV